MLPVPPNLYGGIERIINSLVAQLRNRGHEIALLANRESTCEATVKYAWPGEAGIFNHMKTLRKAVTSFNPNVVHSFSRLAYLLPILRRHGLPKVMSFQREPTPRTIRWASRLAQESLIFTGCSDYISTKGRAGGGTWQTIHNFVDVERYTFRSKVTDTAPLVFLSRVERIKGAHTAIAACHIAGRPLIIAGNHVETEDTNGRYWREEIAPYLGRDGIEYVGPVDDAQKNELLGKAAGLIVPVEWNEPFGIVFAEALACGSPVISSPRGALPEIIRDEVDGFLINSAGEAADAIRMLPKISRTTCRERAEECFSADVVVSRYVQLYESLVTK